MNNGLQTIPICVLYQGCNISVSVDFRFPEVVHKDILNILNRNGGSTAQGIETNDTDKCRVYHAVIDYPGCAIDIMKVVCWYNHELGVELGEYDAIPCFMPDYVMTYSNREPK